MYCDPYEYMLLCRGYLAVTEEGKERLKEGGIEGAYLGPDGYVHIPGKRVTLYSEPSLTKEEMEKVLSWNIELCSFKILVNLIVVRYLGYLLNYTGISLFMLQLCNHHCNLCVCA